MQKIYAFLGSIALALAGQVAWANERGETWAQAAQACFVKDVALERLRCYDDALERPLPQVISLPRDNLLTVRELDPIELRQAREQLRSPYRVGNTVFVRVLERTSGKYLGDLAHDILASAGEAFDELRDKTNLIMTIPSMRDVGEEAILVFSCRENISELQVLWTDPFEGKVARLQIYVGARIDSGKSDDVSMRVMGEGYVLEAPFGYEGFRLAQKMATGNRIQLAVETGETPRTAFFETQDLREAVPLHARFCSWDTASNAKSN